MKKLIVSLLLLLTLVMCSDLSYERKLNIVKQAQPGDTLYLYYIGDIIQECVVIYNKPEEKVIKLNCSGVITYESYITIKSWNAVAHDLVNPDVYIISENKRKL